MSDREKLIALLDAARKHADRECDCRDDCSGCPGDTMRDYCQNPTIADHLLANGVVVREKVEWGNPVKVDAEHNGYKCSKCGEFGAPCWHFCPNCGADMRGEVNNG